MRAQQVKINPDTGETEFEDIEIETGNEPVKATRAVSDEKRLEFEKLCRPLIKWLNDNYHPHVKVLVDCARCELVEGLMGIPIDDYILD